MAVSGHGFKRPWRTRLVLSAAVLSMLLILYRFDTDAIQLLVPNKLREYSHVSHLIDAISAADVRVSPYTIKTPPLQTDKPQPQHSAPSHMEQQAPGTGMRTRNSV